MHAKSISNGNGDARYTTFIKIWKTGVLDVDENRVLTISRRKNYLRDDESFVGERAREDLFGQDRKGKIKRLFFVIESTERQFPRHSLERALTEIFLSIFMQQKQHSSYAK